MLSRIDVRQAAPRELTRARLLGVLPRAALDVAAAAEQIRPVCEDVRRRGGEAVRQYTRTFDGVDVPVTRVPDEELHDALAKLDPDLRAALEEAARRTTLVHTAQLRPDVTTIVADGLAVTGRFVPVARAGVYVPGGLTALPSSVVMNVIPAQVAGVTEIAVASPPQAGRGGLPSPVVLAACALLGVTEVHAAGGAQALAMFAYGTGECAPADVITGPGNVYVAAAKRVLRGVVGTDGENGPTEIAIVADGTANPGYLAADLIAQAEHDPLAACLLITPDDGLADRVDAELAARIPAARHRERIEQALAGQSALVLTASIDAALAVADAWAPEHLEIHARDAATLARRVRSAGAVFAGPYTPVSLGDYLAGSNHVLPTGGSARHSAGLSVLPFLRLVNVVECTRDALAAAAPHVDALGGAEDLPGHVAAIRARLPVETP
ncbi:MAG TPA: histidinol dehydrogenase [Streptosporangiaceae bacterium]